MDLDGPLRAQTFRKVERPPTLWEAETEVEPFLALLGQMIALGIGRGNELGDLTLSMSNVVVEPDGDDEEAEWIPAGEYVAITVRGAGAWNDDTRRAGRGPATGPLRSLGPVADAAGAVCVYARDLAPEGSVTALLRRLVPPT